MLTKIYPLFLAVALFFPLALTATEKVINDNFDAELTNWNKPSNRFLKIDNGELVNSTVYGSSLSLKEKDIGEFDLSFRLKLLSGGENLSGHFSIGIDRDYGKWNIYLSSNNNNSWVRSQFLAKNWKKGQKPLFQQTTNMPLPLDTWINVQIIARKNLYKLKLGDKSFVLGTAPGKGGLSFGSYRQPFAIDDFKLSYSEPEKLSPNLLINSSFEYATNPDIPDCWAGNGERYRNQGLPSDMSTAEGLKEFHEKFYIDRNNAFHGKNSICIKNPFHLLSKITKVPKKKNYTISCYIKADTDNQQVKLGATNDSIKKLVKEKVIEVGKNWKRYELLLSDYPQEKLSFMAKPLADGKIWVDAVQIEAGDKATPFMPCWYDGGFSLPDDVNKYQCSNNVNGIKYNLRPKEIVASKDCKISNLQLTPINPLKNTYSLTMNLENKGNKDKQCNITVCMTAKNEAEQFRTCSKTLQASKIQSLTFEGFVIKKDLRVCIATVITDDNGELKKQVREFIDVPRPIKIYAEYSFYTNEKDANIMVQFDSNINKYKDCKLKIEAFSAGYMQYPRSKNTVDLNPINENQIVCIPIKQLKAGKRFTVRAQVIDSQGAVVLSSEAYLIKQYPAKTEVKINRINRGIYVNGKPFLPYGILVRSLTEKQLEYYKKCGFSYIQFISHWNKMENNLKFLENCKKLDINAVAFHVARPYAPDPSDAAKIYQSSPALIGIVPNDESADRIVYDRAIMTKAANPAILNCANHHFHSYRAFANRIDGFPGDVLSIDRYPFILQPPGRPQTTNDIFSFKLCLEMLDKDGKRERKPGFLLASGS